MVIGLILLVYEVRQNTNLTRAQMSMERTIATTQILADMANGGDLIPIDAKLRGRIDGFPQALGWSEILTVEERRRYEFWMLLRLVEMNNDWFQCAEGLMPPDVCQRDVRANMRQTLRRFYELDISFTRSDPTFITAMQEYAHELGLPDVGDDGSWQPGKTVGAASSRD